MKRVFIGIIVTFCAIMGMSIQANAQTYYATATNANTFSKDWEITSLYYSDKEKTKEIGKMVYGFDTYAIDEDYCWTRNYRTSHQAGVCNDKGQFYGFVMNTTKWSKKEVAHKGNKVIYSYWVDDSGSYYLKLQTNTSVK